MLIVCLISVATAVFVLIKNRKPLLNKIFSLILFSTAIWSGFFFVLYGYAQTQKQALIYSRCAHAAAFFIPVFFLHFALIFLRQIKKKKKILIFAYLWGVTLLFFIPTKFFIRGMSVKAGFFAPLTGPIYPFYLIGFVFWVFYCSFQFVKGYKLALGRKRSQLKYMILAIFFGFGAGSTAFLRSYISVPPIYAFFIPLYAIMIAYAILKYHLMEITVIIRKSIIYSLLTLFITSLFILNVFWGQKFFQKTLGFSPWVISLLAAIVIAISFRPLEDSIAKATDKIFFKARYNYQKTLKETTQAVTSIVELDELLRLLFKTLTQTVKVKQPRLFLLDSSSNQFIEKFPKSAEREKITALKIDKDSPLVLLLKKQKAPVVLEEITYALSRTALKKQEAKELKAVQSQLEKIKAALSIPLIYKGELIGILNLGPKLSGDAFTNMDLTLLTTLTNQTTIAVKNAELIEDLRKSKKALEETGKVLEIKVRARTRELQELAQGLEDKVKQRTKELQERIKELEKFRRLTVGRELKMVELKRKIRKMEAQLREANLALRKYTEKSNA